MPVLLPSWRRRFRTMRRSLAQMDCARLSIWRITRATPSRFCAAVIRAKMKAAQNLLGVALVILQIERRAQSICANDRRMVRKRRLHEGNKTGIAALARSHLLAHHA